VSELRVSGGSRPPTAAERRRRAEQAARRLGELRGRIDAQAAGLRTGDDWRRWLALAGRPPGLTADNTLAVLAARPEATDVDGYDAWQTRGRQIRRGERGIPILAAAAAPSPVTYVWDVAQTDPADGETAAAAPPAGRPAPAPQSQPEAPVRRPGGRPAPPAAFAASLAGVLAARGYETADDAGGGVSWADRDGRVVHLPDGDDPATRAGRLAHQIAHLVLHPGLRLPPHGGCTGREQAEAEMAAYLVAAHAGVDVPLPVPADPASWLDPGPPAVAAHAAARRVVDAAAAIHAELARQAPPTSPASAAVRAEAGDVRSARPAPPTAGPASRAERGDVRPARPVSPTAGLASRAEQGDIRPARSASSQAGAGADPASVVRLHAVLADAAVWYGERLHEPSGLIARRMLADRGLARVVAGDPRWTVGFAPPGWTHLTDHLRRSGHTDGEIEAAGLAFRTRNGRLVDLFRDRVVFAVRDADGQVVSFIGRATGRALGADPATPKYLNIPATAVYEKGRVLFGLHENRDALASGGVPVVVEGVTDVLAAAAAGLDGGEPIPAVAPSGTAFTPAQAAALLAASPGRRGIVVAFDADNAGRAAAARAYDLLYAGEPRLLSADLPVGADPADLLRTAGPEALRAALTDPARLRPLAAAAIDARLAWWETEDRLAFYEQRLAAARSVAPVIVGEPPTQVAALITHTAARLGIPAADVSDVVVEAALDADGPTLARPAGRGHSATTPSAASKADAADAGRLAAVAFPSPTSPAAPSPRRRRRESGGPNGSHDDRMRRHFPDQGRVRDEAAARPSAEPSPAAGAATDAPAAAPRPGGRHGPPAGHRPPAARTNTSEPPSAGWRGARR
jgi:DNA primase